VKICGREKNIGYYVRQLNQDSSENKVDKEKKGCILKPKNNKKGYIL